MLRLHYNFVGSMLPFGAGILAGRYADRLGVSLSQWQWAVVVVVASALIFVMGFHFLSWLWIPLVIIVGTIALVKTLPRWLLTVLMWFGGISAAMFVAHPIARRLFIRIAWKGDVYDGLMLYVIAAIALSWVVKKLIEQIPQPKQNP